MGGGALLSTGAALAAALLLLNGTDDGIASEGSLTAAEIGGPIHPPPSGWSMSVSGDVPYTHAGLIVTNPTPTPIILEQVQLLDADEGLHMVGSLAGKRKGIATIAFPGFPPRGVAPWIEGELRPLRGYRVAPGQEAQVFLGVDVDRSGRHVFRSLRLLYRYQGTLYQADFPIGFALCTPAPSDSDCAPLEPLD